MPLNRYDQPAQSNALNTFVETYSPIPFNEMMQVGTMKQQQYEQAQNSLMKTYEDTYNLKYIPGSKDEQYIKGHVIPATKEIFDKYSNEDLSDPVVRRQLRMDLSSKVDKSKVKDIQDSWMGWAQNEQVKQKLAEEGKYADYLDKDAGGYDTSVHGVWNFHTPAKLDYRKQAEEYFNNLEPDSYLNDNGEIIRYINPSKISHTASGVVQHFKETNEGRQKLREYESTHGVKLSDKEAEQVLNKYLNEVGKEKLTTQIAGFEPGYEKNHLQNSAPAQPVSYSPRFSLAGVTEKDVPSVEDLTGVKQKGFFSKILDVAKEGFTMAYGNPKDKQNIKTQDSDAVDKLFSGNVVSSSEKTQQYKQIEKQAKEMFKYKGTDEKQLSDLTKKYIEHFYTKDHSIPVYELPTEQSAEESNSLMFNKNNMATNREFYDTDKPLTSTSKMQYSELVDEYPQSKYLYNVVGAVGANNPMFPSGRQINIYKKDDKGQPTELVKTFYMGADEMEKQKGSFANKFHQINYEILGDRKYNDSYWDSNLGKAVPMEIYQKRVDSFDGDRFKIGIKFKVGNTQYQFPPKEAREEQFYFPNTESALAVFKQYYDSITQAKQ
jgi:hypothetical protein